MNDIAKIGDYYYLTSTAGINGVIAPKIIRTTDLSRLANNEFEDIYSYLNFKDIPYFINYFDNTIFISEIGDNFNGIVSFKPIGNTINDVAKLFEFEGVSSKMLLRKNQFSL